MPKPTAQDKRFAAIAAIMATYVDDHGVRLITDGPGARMDLVEAIAALAPLGRTERWQMAVKKWANMVDNTDNELDWAMLQGQIFCGYGAL